MRAREIKMRRNNLDILGKGFGEQSKAMGWENGEGKRVAWGTRASSETRLGIEC